MKNKQLIALALLGGAAALYLMNQQPPRYTGQYANIPPPPPRNSPNYQQWVQTILQTFGQVADLWKPGGPFYQQPVPQPPVVNNPAGTTAPNNPAHGGVFGPWKASPLVFLLPGI